MPSNPADKPPAIPRPPTKEEVDVISREQAMITDEWSGPGEPPAKEGSTPGQ